MKILVINGPNLNMLGIREPGIYGSENYNSLLEKISAHAEKNDVSVEFFQSNHEGLIVDKLQEADGGYDGVIINPGPFTQTSHAIRVTLGSLPVPTVEVHLVNILKTGEPTIPGRNVTCVISGLGKDCYLLGVDAIRHALKV